MLSCLGQASSLDNAILPKRISTIRSGIVTKRTITDPGVTLHRSTWRSLDRTRKVTGTFEASAASARREYHPASYGAPCIPSDGLQQEIRMKWGTFQTEGGGLLKVQAQHVAAIYDELGVARVSTTAGCVHTLSSGITVQKAATLVSEAAEASPR